MPEQEKGARHLSISRGTCQVHAWHVPNKKPVTKQETGARHLSISIASLSWKRIPLGTTEKGARHLSMSFVRQIVTQPSPWNKVAGTFHVPSAWDKVPA